MRLLVIAFLSLGGSVAIGWAIGEILKARPAAGAAWGLAGPLGWLVVIGAYPGAVRCPSCRRRTPWHPEPASRGPTAAHLRCRHCRSVL